MQRQYNLARRSVYLQKPVSNQFSLGNTEMQSSMLQLPAPASCAIDTVQKEGPEISHDALCSEIVGDSTGSLRSWEVWDGWEEGEKYRPPPDYVAYEDDAEAWPGKFRRA